MTDNALYKGCNQITSVQFGLYQYLPFDLVIQAVLTRMFFLFILLSVRLLADRDKKKIMLILCSLDNKIIMLRNMFKKNQVLQVTKYESIF